MPVWSIMPDSTAPFGHQASNGSASRRPTLEKVALTLTFAFEVAEPPGDARNERPESRPHDRVERLNQRQRSGVQSGALGDQVALGRRPAGSKEGQDAGGRLLGR